MSGATEDVETLRARLTEAEAVIVNAQDQLPIEHPVWWILDDYDGSMDSVKTLKAERDAARAEVGKLREQQAQMERQARVSLEIAERAQNRRAEAMAEVAKLRDAPGGEHPQAQIAKGSHGVWMVGCDFCHLDKWTYVYAKAEGFALGHDEGR